MRKVRFSFIVPKTSSRAYSPRGLEGAGENRQEFSLKAAACCGAAYSEQTNKNLVENLL